METLSIVGLTLSRVWHVGRDVDQSDNRRIRSRFGNDGAAITVSHKNAWSILQSEDLGLNDDEVAFYDALAQNNSAVEAMGKDELKVIAAELVTQVRKSVTIDWTLRESARAKIKVLVNESFESTALRPTSKPKPTKTSSRKPSCLVRNELKRDHSLSRSAQQKEPEFWCSICCVAHDVPRYSGISYEKK